MTTELMTVGLANCLALGDPAVEARPSATDSVETTVGSTANEMAGAQSNVDPNADANGADANVNANADSWRVEVAARLERYRNRRKPRTPRYPSLRLPFDAPESWSRPAPASGAGVAATALALTGKEFVFQTNAAPAEVTEPDFAGPRQISEQASEPRPHRYTEQATEPSAKVIEFPRSAAIPVFHPSDLADPVFDRDRPRIVEAPEILPPPPALGGMLMEPAHKEPVERQAGTDFPSASASIARRALAALVDSAILATALTAIGAIFLRLNPGLSPVRQPLPLLTGPTLAAALAVAAIALWAVYEFLFVVYTGSTPGLRAARVRLAAFDGSPLNRRVRRWRVLASLLSALSVGLGYFWCVLDQDGLCWHDRITRTHVQLAVRRD